jgi:hypothetical protein
MWGGRDVAVLIQAVSRNPARHQHHGHPRAGVSSAASQIETGNVRPAVGGFKRPREASVAGQAVNRPIEHAVASVDIGWRERMLVDNAALDILKTGGASQFIEDGAPLSRQHLLPIVVIAQIRRVH